VAQRSLVVVPTFNEAESIEQLVAAVLGTFECDVLVVDDASPDGTGLIADAYSGRDARVHVLHRACKAGIGSAYVAGFKWGLHGEYSRFFEMDADFSHDPHYLPLLLTVLDDGADVVVGSRNIVGGKVEGLGAGRHVLSRGGSLYARCILGVGIRDMTSGYKGYTREALRALRIETIRSNGYAFQIETTYRALKRGLKVVEWPIVFVDRRAGKSKMSRKEVWEGVVRVWEMRASRGL
jgi:dolichol-phosphate mannosyltransferase